MLWLFSGIFILFSAFATDLHRSVQNMILTEEVSEMVDLDTILERIAEIDASSKLNKLIDKILIENKDFAAKRHSKVVIIDAGHGGKDPGTHGTMGTIEKKIVLQYAVTLHNMLQNAGYTVLMTRNKDEYISLIQRRKFAELKKGSLMISLHADSAHIPQARGLSVYTLSDKATDEVAQMLAQSHDDNDMIFRSSAKDILVKTALIDVAQRVSISKSEYFASILVNNAQKAKLFCIPKTHRKAGFAVLKMPNVPSVLIELGFLSNPEEEILLSSPAYKNTIINAIFKSVDQFFGIS